MSAFERETCEVVWDDGAIGDEREIEVAEDARVTLTATAGAAQGPARPRGLCVGLQSPR